MQKTSNYFEAVGRRKTAIARVRIVHADKNAYLINGKSVNEYFAVKELQNTVLEAVASLENKGKYSVSIKVYGGGIASQAEAIRHGIARALVKSDPQLRTGIKKAGFLKRDPRAKERRKFGLKKARKSPQWSKR